MALPLTAVPCSLQIGDTLDLVLSFSGYPAPAYDAVMYFTAFGKEPITVTSTDYGSDFRFINSGGGTANWAPGTYDFAVRVDGPGGTLTLLTGKITLLPNPAAFTSTTDNRSHARRTLDILQALVEGRVVSGIENYSIDGRQVSKTPLKDLIALRDRYQAIVTAEENKALGRSSLRHHKVQFTRV